MSCLNGAPRVLGFSVFGSVPATRYSTPFQCSLSAPLAGAFSRRRLPLHFHIHPVQSKTTLLALGDQEPQLSARITRQLGQFSISPRILSIVGAAVCTVNAGKLLALEEAEVTEAGGGSGGWLEALDSDKVVTVIVLVLFAMGVYVTIASVFLTWYNWRIKKRDEQERKLIDELVPDDRTDEDVDFESIVVKDGKIVEGMPKRLRSAKGGRVPGRASRSKASKGQEKSESTVKMNREQRRLAERMERLEKKRKKRKQVSGTKD